MITRFNVSVGLLAAALGVTNNSSLATPFVRENPWQIALIFLTLRRAAKPHGISVYGFAYVSCNRAEDLPQVEGST